MLALAASVAGLACAAAPERDDTKDDGIISYAARDLSRVSPDSLRAAPLWSTAARADDPAFDLSQLHEAVLLPTGAVVALSRIGSQVVWFSRDEGAARVVGRVGGGPGEFRSPTGLVVHGDSVGVLDPANGRVQWVDAEGFPRTSQRIKGLVGGVTGIAGVFRGGRVVLHAAGRVPGTMPSRRRTDASVWIGSDTVELAQIASIPDVRLVERTVEARGRRDVMVDHVRLAPSAHVVALEAHLVIASDSAFRLRLLDDHGVEQLRVELEWPLHPITTDARRAHADDELQRRMGMQRETPVDEVALRRSVDEATYATVTSAIRALHLAPDGDFWVVATPAAADVRGEALRFSSEGELRSRLQWQHAGEPIAFGTDRVLFTHRRADGHVELRAHAIVPGT
jgi:hypothetical protein